MPNNKDIERIKLKEGELAYEIWKLSQKVDRLEKKVNEMDMRRYTPQDEIDLIG